MSIGAVATSIIVLGVIFAIVMNFLEWRDSKTA
jgi:hypothetical protein